MAPDNAEHQATVKDLIAKVDDTLGVERHWHYMEITGTDGEAMTYCPFLRLWQTKRGSQMYYWSIPDRDWKATPQPKGIPVDSQSMDMKSERWAETSLEGLGETTEQQKVSLEAIKRRMMDPTRRWAFRAASGIQYVNRYKCWVLGSHAGLLRYYPETKTWAKFDPTAAFKKPPIPAQ